MNPSNPDIQLTAYALGELSEDERRAVEARIQADPALQAAVDEIRALAAQLETELAGEPAPALSDAQRQAILDASAGGGGRLARFPWRRLTGFAAVAAAVTLVFGGVFWTATRSLHGTLLARIDEKGEMAIMEYEEQQLDELLEELSPPDELADLVIPVAPPEVEMGMTPPPDIQEFAAAPVMYEVAELEIASERLSPKPKTMPDVSAPAAHGISGAEAVGSVNGKAFPADGRDRMQRVSASGIVVAGRQDDSWIKLGKAPAHMTVSFQDAPSTLANRAAGRASSLRGYGGGIPACCPPPDGIPPLSNTESYAPIKGNAFKSILEEPLSTFSIDVDTASYANIRRFLQAGQLPPPDAVRIEEMINYFPYTYEPPREGVPFAVHVESAACPWAPSHALVKIGLKGRDLDAESRPPCNLVFLIDVSGSMSSENKLPLVKKSLRLLARQLTENDRVSIVVYASATGLVLPPTPGSQLAAINAAIDNLQAGGSTAGGAGIRLAYDQARETFLKDGNNRVILCTDGDFNVGITDSDELASFIAERAKQGIFLTILGFGMGNYKDDRLETLSNKGNGNYAYIDTFSEARKNLAEQAAGTLFTIAKDVKLQIEFNPARFASYRLVGYENRLLAKEDFNDDQKDAGELGAGHTVTAFYELIPHGVEPPAPAVDPLKYQPQPAAEEEPAAPAIDLENASPEWLTVKLRYKLPDQDTSTKIEVPFTGTFSDFSEASADFRFAAGVAAAGYLMRHDSAVHSIGFPDVVDCTAAATGPDPEGYRREFIDLLKNAAVLDCP
ncbi:MAG TPA: von Willebrand factor type A domain-containing protein [Kiritimatiellia bacterium]|nr:von Willebrand factor type A domain-containing protein [Kiritimatiellia bacterium]